MRCPNCNASVSEEQRVCPYCGTLFSEQFPLTEHRFGFAAISGFVLVLIAGGIGAFTSCCGGLVISLQFAGRRPYVYGDRYLAFWPIVTGGAMGALGILATMFLISRFYPKNDPAKITLRHAAIVLLILWFTMFIVSLAAVN